MNDHKEVLAAAGETKPADFPKPDPHAVYGPVEWESQAEAMWQWIQKRKAAGETAATPKPSIGLRATEIDAADNSGLKPMTSGRADDIRGDARQRLETIATNLIRSHAEDGEWDQRMVGEKIREALALSPPTPTPAKKSWTAFGDDKPDAQAVYGPIPEPAKPLDLDSIAEELLQLAVDLAVIGDKGLTLDRKFVDGAVSTLHLATLPPSRTRRVRAWAVYPGGQLWAVYPKKSFALMIAVPGAEVKPVTILLPRKGKWNKK
jgi:hypothetical protein